jgi:outer membrane receptor protein involved in Fe transport
MLEIFALLAFSSVAIEEIVVTSTRRDAPLSEHTGNVTALGQDTIDAVAHAHIHELLTRVPGVWVVRGSGQESLPSIRSPVLTGAGSCGAFLVLENGIPTRPAGFCNVNQLFELPTELARRIEVIRGPGNALYGSNALHGTINVVLPRPVDGDGLNIGLELGANDFVRVEGDAAIPGISRSRIGLVHVDDGGFRDDSGYRQTKALLGKDVAAWGGELALSFTATDLDQETAGFILGLDAYKDPDLKYANLNPEAYREATSQRLAAHWSGQAGRFALDIRPFLRRTDMEFLQHFLPGKPLEENGHVSAGMLTMLSVDSEGRHIDFGLDIEWADVFLRETQFGPTEGSDFLRETRPEGKHYDYGVDSLGIAGFVRMEFGVGERLTIDGGLRAEYLRYDYVNNMLDGNTRDDGTLCGFGGCLYTRPASRSDDFTDVAPKLGARWKISDSSSTYMNIARGFRVPQMTELYRLQSGQQVSDLESETVDSIEVGVRASRDVWQLDIAAFTMKKRNSVYRDGDGYNVTGGRSRHRGVEMAWDWMPHARWRLSLAGTWARHVYDFDAVAARGETFVSGNDVDTAPRWQGSLELQFLPTDNFDAALQWVSLGDYYLDVANAHSYPGHDLLNLRLHYRLNGPLDVSLRMNNVLDEDYADRADFAFGNYRYFPGRGREVFVKFQYRAQDSH